MKKSAFYLLIILMSVPFVALTSQNKEKTVQVTKSTKLSIDQRVKIMTKELKLTAPEQVQVSQILTSTQVEKDKIKASNVSTRKKEEQVEYIKDIQKAKLKKLLGKDRYKKYKTLKDKDIL